MLKRLARTGLSRWWNGGSSPWFYLGVAAMLIRVVRRLSSTSPDVQKIRLKPGEVFEVTSRRR